jgi:predicted TIM-barrel enzyme
MSIVTKTFGVSCAVLPVIHIECSSQAHDEAMLAFDCGANGVFLIEHHGNYGNTVEIAESVTHYLRSEGHATPFVGVNLLGIERPADAYQYLHCRSAWDVRGVWCDTTAADGVRLETIKHEDSDGVWRSLFFASCAFKYQPQPLDVAEAAWREIALGADVVTTSGPATGKACDPAKVRAIRAAVGEHYGVAVASGVTPDNAASLVRAGVDHILVATGIAKDIGNGKKDFHRMAPAKLRALIANVREAAR